MDGFVGKTIGCFNVRSWKKTVDGVTISCVCFSTQSPRIQEDPVFRFVKEETLELSLCFMMLITLTFLYSWESTPLKRKRNGLQTEHFFSSRTINILWAFSFEHKDIIHFHSFNSAVASCHYDRPKMTSCTQNLWIPWHSTPLLFISGNFLVGQLTWKWKNRQLQSKQWHLQPKPNSVGFHWELPYGPPSLSSPQFCI